ncbi:hypothetical protein [Xanthomonas sp. A1809]|uniref:hypothetical protein n=1 Tax=Xanthomonas sp. A1809 TaxID=2821275 RepID=UPI001ADBC27A|nr:hypothetical protein [Xanthomonas sp. A1809]MBO9858601.1 hypothetical protein [Xanthomonas sp. A1809]
MENNKKNEVWFKKNFALAVPALAFSCGYIYEWGRFSYLKIPAEMIDLPVTRLIASGIALVTTFLFAAAGLARLNKFFASKQRIVRYIGVTVLLYMAVAMPFMVLTHRQQGPMVWLLWSVPGWFALTAWFQGSHQGNPSNDEVPAVNEESSLTEFGMIAFLGVLTAINIFSLGYIIESVQIRRSCVEDKKRTLVVEVQSGRLLIKEVEKKGIMRDWVIVNRSDDAVKIFQCQTQLKPVIKIFNAADEVQVDPTGGKKMPVSQ